MSRGASLECARLFGRWPNEESSFDDDCRGRAGSACDGGRYGAGTGLQGSAPAAGVHLVRVVNMYKKPIQPFVLHIFQPELLSNAKMSVHSIKIVLTR